MTGYNTSHITKIVNVLKKEYKNLLKRAHQINKLNKQKIEKAKVFLFIYNILIRNKDI